MSDDTPMGWREQFDELCRQEREREARRDPDSRAWNEAVMRLYGRPDLHDQVFEIDDVKVLQHLLHLALSSVECLVQELRQERGEPDGADLDADRDRHPGVLSERMQVVIEEAFRAELELPEAEE